MDKELEDFIEFYKSNKTYTAKGLIKKMLPLINNYLDSGVSLRQFTINILQEKYNINISYKTVSKWYNYFNENREKDKIKNNSNDNSTKENIKNTSSKSPMELLNLKKIEGANK